MHTTKLVILGRDGILNKYREDHVKSPAEWVPIAGALEAVARLNHAGWHAVVATNQAGIGRGLIDMASINAIHAHMNQQLLAQGGRLDAVFFCPHTPEEGCSCRKPLPGMMRDIGLRYGVDLRHVPMVCDTLRDLQAAQAAGCEPHLVESGRATGLNPEQVAQMVEKVPGTVVHSDLGAFAEFLLRRDHIDLSTHGSLA
ncbi:MAG: D-glycero-beta-D-manno-heptose 1,7-bisphosphate 7-phosphatase [Betaproteobacteria bacterium]|nr:D-glycero-beta-D-manno-heptose 1,7-bisphosphate 7-phosphatase [Betaproteobacteria bacterium]MCC6247361.1 D-glycero-beta-D-manno-heptose 1,7-bisphosphate 7-phosphatase [Rubrivivax sp.]MCL4698668.1 D-glycero-beta-D-manno-heptose 1,7-bisphosphate 7-phosphatase [Burkholderiaceae bacterium]